MTTRVDVDVDHVVRREEDRQRRRSPTSASATTPRAIGVQSGYVVAATGVSIHVPKSTHKFGTVTDVNGVTAVRHLRDGRRHAAPSPSPPWSPAAPWSRPCSWTRRPSSTCPTSARSDLRRPLRRLRGRRRGARRREHGPGRLGAGQDPEAAHAGPRQGHRLVGQRQLVTPPPAARPVTAGSFVVTWTDKLGATVDTTVVVTATDALRRQVGTTLVRRRLRRAPSRPSIGNNSTAGALDAVSVATYPVKA